MGESINDRQKSSGRKIEHIGSPVPRHRRGRIQDFHVATTCTRGFACEPSQTMPTDQHKLVSTTRIADTVNE